MQKLKTFFNTIKGRMIVGALVTCLVVSAAAIGLMSTLASSDIEKEFPCTNTYSKVALGASVETYGGIHLVRSSNTALISTSVNNNQAMIQGGTEKTGVASIAYLTLLGQINVINHQVYDPSGVSGYRIPDGQIQIRKVKETSVPINVLIQTNNGSAAEQSLSQWNAANPYNKVEWESLHKGVIEIVSDTTMKTVANGSAMIVGTVTDKWGVKQSIPVLVTVGTAAYVIDDEKGSYWLPGDKEHTYVETDQDGKILIPPNTIYNPDGPGSGTPNIELKRGDDGKYYVRDDQNPNIWHEFDTETGKKKEDGDSIWGGENFEPGGGDDKPADKDSDSGNWWVDLGQNIFDRVNPNGNLAGDLTGGGLEGIPYPNGVKPIWYNQNDGKYYVGPLGPDEDENLYYYGDAPGSKDGVQSSKDSLAPTDVAWYLDENGNMTTTKPKVAPPSVEGISIAIPPTVTEYKVGETFSPSGMTLKVTYSDGSEKLIDSGFTFSPTSAFTKANENTIITIIYETQTATQSVKVVPSVTAVNISPGTANVTKGETQKFDATVEGLGSPAETVTWSVNSSAGSTINASGLLTVALGETAESLIVTATSTVDTTKKATAVVTVNKADQAALTISSPATHTYGSSYAITATGGSGTGAVTYAIVTGGTGAGTISGSTLNVTTAGTILIRATKAADTSYNQQTSANFTLTVNKANQVAMSINSSATHTFGSNYTITSTGGSGTGAVSYAVVTGGTGAGTISGSTLSITKAGTIILKATKATDTNYNAQSSANFTLTVSKPITQGPGTIGNRTLDNSKTGDGTWVEIATNGDYSLIVRANSATTSTFCTGSTYIAYASQTATSGNVRYAVNNWFNSTLGASARLRNYTVTSDALNKPGTWASLNASNGFSVPTTTEAKTGNDVAFLLSFQEAASYCNRYYYNGSIAVENSGQAYLNWQKLEDRTSTNSWLRSPGYGTTYASYLGSPGSVNNNSVAYSLAVRPALWVKSDIWNP